MCALLEVCVSIVYKQDGLCQLHNATCVYIAGGYDATTLYYKVRERTSVLPTDCEDNRICQSGVYRIKIQDAMKPIEMYCEVDAQGKHWTVFQRRQDGSEDFYRNWDDYENGFGNVAGEFWLGNINLNTILSQGSYQLRVDMSDFEENSVYAAYSLFDVGDASTNYQLTVGGYSGTAGDGFAIHNNMSFSTYDRDLDEWGGKCAVDRRGAWWYRGCCDSNLNGKYLGGEHTTLADGVNWVQWKGRHYSLKSSTMKIRRLDS
ncbi:hypothetical protein ScPMuIL_010484 [Solemya velum]